MNVGTKLYGNLSINHGQLIKNVSVKLQIDAREKFGGQSGRIIILEYIPTHVETVQFKPNLNPPWRHPLDCPLLFWRLKFCIIIFEPQVTVFGQEGWAGEDILIKTD